MMKNQEACSAHNYTVRGKGIAGNKAFLSAFKITRRDGKKIVQYSAIHGRSLPESVALHKQFIFDSIERYSRFITNVAV